MRTEKKKGLTSSKYPEENCHHFHLSGDGNAQGCGGMLWLGRVGLPEALFPTESRHFFCSGTRSEARGGMRPKDGNTNLPLDAGRDRPANSPHQPLSSIMRRERPR